ncbi:MAG TPA: diguanylate cyclase [Solirubrobacteraceae bacterium]|nr:diguanylate cyclase [Solirubrobacteraceae bacterium]
MTSTSTLTPSETEWGRQPEAAVPTHHSDPGTSLNRGKEADGRASDPVDRLLEESWEARSRRAGRREVLAEVAAGGLFLAAAGPMAALALSHHHLDLRLTLLLVGLYALVAGTVRFPLGAGYVVPTYVVLVPMLLLLPAGAVPLLTAGALLTASAGRWLMRRGSPGQMLFAVPNAWHAVGPALVLELAGLPHDTLARAGVYLAAFLAGALVDLATSTLREAAALAVPPHVQLRVVALIWLIDACIAPLGLLLTWVAAHDHSKLLMMLPLFGLLFVLDRDRNARISQAQHRLALVGRERVRLQAAVGRLGEAFAAKLDIEALTRIALVGSVDALDADAGRLVVELPDRPGMVQSTGSEEALPLVIAATSLVSQTGRPEQLQQNGSHVLVMPLQSAGQAEVRGTFALVRRDREFQPDEQALLQSLVERTSSAVADILAHEALRELAMTDSLTRLGNRRKLADDLSERLTGLDSSTEPLVLVLFDLDGFKSYNDTFGHPAGDALLARLGRKLALAIQPHGTAYRLGGDEFCAVLDARPEELHRALSAATAALNAHGDDFFIHASYGAVLVPHEASTPEYALQLADERMYAHKERRPSGTREQTRNVLLRIMQARERGLAEHIDGVARLAVAVGRRLGMNNEQLDELMRAAELHDIGKLGIPDSILDKPGELDPEEWEFVRQHTVLGERILSAAPALRPVATVVRATHERWDGRGYPDRLRGQDIPLGARIIAVCDAYDAITSDRCYRKARSPEAACRELLRDAGHQFDPEVVEAFLHELEEWQTSQAQAGQLDRAHQHAREVADRLLQILDPVPVAEVSPAG